MFIEHVRSLVPFTIDIHRILMPGNGAKYTEQQTIVCFNSFILSLDKLWVFIRFTGACSPAISPNQHKHDQQERERKREKNTRIRCRHERRKTPIVIEKERERKIVHCSAVSAHRYETFRNARRTISTACTTISPSI